MSTGTLVIAGKRPDPGAWVEVGPMDSPAMGEAIEIARAMGALPLRRRLGAGGQGLSRSVEVWFTPAMAQERERRAQARFDAWYAANKPRFIQEREQRQARQLAEEVRRAASHARMSRASREAWTRRRATQQDRPDRQGDST